MEGGGVLNGDLLTAQDTSRITENQAAAGGGRESVQPTRSLHARLV